MDKQGIGKRILAYVMMFAMILSTLVTYAPVVEVYAAEKITINESSGWLESAYVEWGPVSGAEGYRVYVKKTSESDYTQIDDELIRQYDEYWRADALGLAVGNYNMKVVAVKGSTEIASAETGTLTVSAHDRSGFAWVNGTASGAYNENGTLRDDAQVVYITEATKDSVTMDVITSSKGATTSCKGIVAILAAYKKGRDSRPLNIRIVGEVTDSGIIDSDSNCKGDLIIDTVACGVTFEGVGEDATANGWGLRIKGASNVEVRNIGFLNCNSNEGDNIGLQQDNDHIWVHNCDMFYGDAGSDADQIKGDGALDCKLSTYVTFSYNHFYDNGKCNLLGLSEGTTEDLFITYHHNWYDHSDSRHPRVRYYSAHVYNNYYDGNAKYGIGACLGSSIFAENNYFRNCKFPMLISMQGSDVFDTDKGVNDYANMATFSKEAGGIIKAFGNYIEGASRFVTQSDSSTEFDAVVVSSRDEKVGSEYAANMATPSNVSFKTGSAGNTYNNFDTSTSMYSYTADTAEVAKNKVVNYSGRMNGGDLKWTFDESEDESYAVNEELKAVVTAYKSSVVSIGGNGGSGSASGSTPSETEGETTQPTEAPTTSTTAAATQATTAAPTQAATEATEAPTSSSTSAELSFESVGGWSESIYAQLKGVSDTNVTGVSYSGTTSGSLTGDDLKYLVRDNNGGVRIDVPGLSAGSYTLTITTTKGTISQSGLNVIAYDRSGYAHFNYTAGVGAYNDDGTLKDNAIVLYITDENKDTVAVTSKDGTTVTGIGNILNSAGKDNGSGKNSKGGIANSNAEIIKKLAEEGTPLVVRVIGNVTAPAGVTAFDSVDYGGSVGDNGGMARMQSGKDITIEGIGYDAGINGWGIHFICESGSPELGKSFEVRNITFTNVPEDCIGMEGQQEGTTITASVERCWVHNCSFYVPNISNPAESDKAQGDGACDFKRGQYFTNSYCYYEGYHKTNLVGSSDTSLQYNLTYHHNYWKNCESRGPLGRQANMHFYNNVYENQISYAMNTRANAYIFSEYNLFYMAKSPQRVDSGAIKSYMDSFSSCINDMGGTVVTDKSQQVSSGNKYENFDTNSSLSYIPVGNYELQESITEARKVIYSHTGVMAQYPIPSQYVTMNMISMLPSGVNADTLTSLPYTTTGEKVSKSVKAFTVLTNVDIEVSYASDELAKTGVLVNEAGEAFLTGSGTVKNLPAGTYMIQPMNFQPGDATKSGTFKEITIASLKVTAVDPNAPTEAPTEKPTETPTEATEAPTEKPTETPTEVTQAPTVAPIEGETVVYSHSFVNDGNNSDFFTITGNLSSDKGTVTYNGVTYTICLKMESSTVIGFATSADNSVLTLVFEDGFNGKVRVDGKEYTASDAILSVNLDSGNHIVTKGDSTNLFYMEVISSVKNSDYSPVEPTVPSEIPTEAPVIKPQDETAVRNYVERLYKNVLNRNSDKSGIDAWTTGLMNGSFTGISSGYHFVFSTECINRNLSNEDYLEMLYNTFMNRKSDVGGKNAWLDFMNNGMSREKVLEGFILSQEFSGICDSYGLTVGQTSDVVEFATAIAQYRNRNINITKFVARCYEKALGRNYEVDGLEAWCKGVIEGDFMPKQVAENFIFSQEFINKNLSNEEYIKVLYRTFMGREADANGLKAWVDGLDAGRFTRKTALEGFAGSMEFTEILKSFGLN